MEEIAKRTGVNLWDLKADERARAVAAVCSGDDLTEMSSEELDTYLV